jgi:hypothetical protein
MQFHGLGTYAMIAAIDVNDSVTSKKGSLKRDQSFG